MRGKRCSRKLEQSHFSKKIYLLSLVSVIIVSVLIGYNVTAKTKVSNVSSVNLQSEIAAKTIEVTNEKKEISTDGQYIYLSDMDYLNQSFTGYGNIQKDKNTDQKTITLKKGNRR